MTPNGRRIAMGCNVVYPLVFNKLIQLGTAQRFGECKKSNLVAWRIVSETSAERDVPQVVFDYLYNAAVWAVRSRPVEALKQALPGSQQPGTLNLVLAYARSTPIVVSATSPKPRSLSQRDARDPRLPASTTKSAVKFCSAPPSLYSTRRTRSTAAENLRTAAWLTLNFGLRLLISAPCAAARSSTAALVSEQPLLNRRDAIEPCVADLDRSRSAPFGVPADERPTADMQRRCGLIKRPVICEKLSDASNRLAG